MDIGCGSERVVSDELMENGTPRFQVLSPELCPAGSTASQDTSPGAPLGISAHHDRSAPSVNSSDGAPVQLMSSWETPPSSENHEETSSQSAQMCSPPLGDGNQAPSIGAPSVQTGGSSTGMGWVVKSANRSSPSGQSAKSASGITVNLRLPSELTSSVCVEEPSPKQVPRIGAGIGDSSSKLTSLPSHSSHISRRRS